MFLEHQISILAENSGINYILKYTAQKIKGTLFNQRIASSQLNSWDIDLVSSVAEGVVNQFQLLWC